MLFGDRLIHERHISQEQLEEALQLQIQDGCRVGSALVKLGYIEMDLLAECLGRHYGMPSILSTHFLEAPPELQSRLSPEQALCWGAIPVGRLTGDDAHIAVAVREPLPPEAIAELTAALGGPIVLAVTSELQIQTQLQRVYGVPAGKRVVRFARARTVGPEPGSDGDIEAEILLEIDRPDQAAEVHGDESGNPSEYGSEAEVHGDDASDASREIDTMSVELHDLSGMDMTAEDIETIETVAEEFGFVGVEGAAESAGAASAGEDAPSPPSEAAVPSHVVDAGSALGRIAIRRASTSQPVAAVLGQSVPTTLDASLRRMRTIMDRDRVADMAVDAMRDFLAHKFDLGAILVARGQTIIGWKGFWRSHDDAWLKSIAIPVGAPSSIRASYVDRVVYVGPPPEDGQDVDGRLWATLKCPPPAFVATAPVAIDDDNLCLLYAHSDRGTDSATMDRIREQFGRLAKTTGKSFKRAMRAAER